MTLFWFSLYLRLSSFIYPGHIFFIFFFLEKLIRHKHYPTTEVSQKTNSKHLQRSVPQAHIFMSFTKGCPVLSLSYPTTIMSRCLQSFLASLQTIFFLKMCWWHIYKNQWIWWDKTFQCNVFELFSTVTYAALKEMKLGTQVLHEDVQDISRPHSGHW